MWYDLGAGGVAGGVVRGIGGDSGWLGGLLDGDGVVLGAFGSIVLSTRGQVRSQHD
jgi:hypothetical protein